MKKLFFIVNLSLVTCLFGCTSRPVKEEAPEQLVESPNIMPGIKPDSLKEHLKVEEEITEDEESDCVRGAAEPIVKKEIFPNSNFQLQPDKLTGIETVKFSNGDKLIIKNTGCEYYTLIFRFETSRFREDTTNFPFWFDKSVILIREIIKGLDSPIEIEKGITAFEAFIKKEKSNDYQNLKLKEEVDFGGDDIRDFVFLERIEKLSGKKYAVEICFSVGPL